MSGAISSVDPGVAKGFEQYLDAGNTGFDEPAQAAKPGVLPGDEAPPPPDHEGEEEAEAGLKAELDAEQPEHAGPDPEEAEEEAEPLAADAEEAEPEGEAINTFAELAETFEVEEDELLEHLQIPTGTEGESVSLKEVVEHYRSAPELNMAAQERVDAEFTRLQSVNEESVKKLEVVTHRLIQKIERHVEPEGGWANLRKSDPGEYLRLMEEQQADRADAEASLAALEENRENFNAEQEERHKGYVQQQAALIYKLRPDWRDKKVGNAAFEEINTYLSTAGFSEEQVQGLEDGLSIITVWKAAQYDKAQAARPGLRKRLRKLPTKHVGASARDEVAPQREQLKARQAKLDKFAASGRIEDATDLFEEHI